MMANTGLCFARWDIEARRALFYAAAAYAHFCFDAAAFCVCQRFHLFIYRRADELLIMAALLPPYISPRYREIAAPAAEGRNARKLILTVEIPHTPLFSSRLWTHLSANRADQRASSRPMSPDFVNARRKYARVSGHIEASLRHRQRQALNTVNFLPPKLTNHCIVVEVRVIVCRAMVVAIYL